MQPGQGRQRTVVGLRGGARVIIRCARLPFGIRCKTGTTMTSTATSAAPATSPSPSRGLNIGLWVAQVLLALAFMAAGFGKSTMPPEALLAQFPWAASSGVALVRFIGVSELLGGLGLLLPAATRIKPFLTPLAAIGLATIMVLAAGFHLVRGEFPAIVFNAILGGIAAFIAWGRLKKAPIAPRG